MSWLHYLIEANIYLGVFYLCYCLLLGNDTHYTLGRVYLIFSCVVAFVLPLTQVSILKPVLPEIEIVELPVQVKTMQANVPQMQIAEPVTRFTFNDALIYLYITGAVIAFFVFIFRLHKLYLLTRNKHSLYQDQYKLIKLDDEHTAFSFFNYLFIGKNIPKAETIIAHELVHIRQKHSADIIFMEAVKVINWFNPFIYLMQRSLKTVHEYIADEQTAAYEQDAITYSSFLLNNAYGIQGSSIAHSFFNYNLLKKRIIMLNKNRSGKLARLKYLAVLPLCAGMLCASTLVFSKDYGVIDLLPRPEKPTVKPTLIKYFKIKDRDITAYSDNLSFTENGIKKTYLAATITDADIAYIKKVRKIEVEVIEVDRKTKMQVPMVIKADAKQDTNKMPPPPPPTMLKESFQDFGRYINIKTVYPKDAIAGKNQGGLIINFHVDGSGTVSNVRLSGKSRTSFDDAILASANAYRGKIKDKAGDYILGVNFIIPGVDDVSFPKPSVTNASNYVGDVHVLGLTPAQRKKLMPPPPPPAPPVQKRMPPPPPPAPKKAAKVPAIEIESVPAAEPKASNKSTKTPQSNAAVKQTAMNQLIDRTLSVKRIIFPFDKNYQLKKGDRC
ncbi:M56 family metallopeptidase [Mucilaginibacter phyllosphaerae]